MLSRSYLSVIFGLSLYLTACKQEVQDSKPFMIELYKSRSFAEIDSMFEVLAEDIDRLHLKTTFIDTQGVWYHIFTDGYQSRERCLSHKIGYEDQLGLNQLKVYDHRALKTYYIANENFQAPSPLLILPQLAPDLKKTLNYTPYLKGFEINRLLFLNKPPDLSHYFLKQFYKTLDLPRGISKLRIQTMLEHGFHINYTSHYGYTDCLVTLLKLKSTDRTENRALKFARQIITAGYYEIKELKRLKPIGQWQSVYEVFIASSSKNIKKTYYILGEANNEYVCFLEVKDYTENILDILDELKNITCYSRFTDTFYYLPVQLKNGQSCYAFELLYLENFKQKRQLYLNGGLESKAYFFDKSKNKVWQGKLYKFYVPANARHVYKNWFRKGETITYKAQWNGKFDPKNRLRNFLAYRIRDYIFILNSSNASAISKQTWQEWAEAWQL